MWSRAKEKEFRVVKEAYERLEAERNLEAETVAEQVDSLLDYMPVVASTVGAELVGNSQNRAKLLALLNHPSIEAMNIL